MSNHAERILYRDGSGRVREHRIVPRSVSPERVSGLPGKQWFIHAFDLDSGCHLDFALTGILASGSDQVDEILRLQALLTKPATNVFWDAALAFIRNRFLTKDPT